MVRHAYRVYDHILGSNIALSWPQATRSTKFDLTFHWQRDQLSAPRPAPWLHHWQDTDGLTWLASARANGGYLLRLKDLADFWLSATGETIRGTPLAEFSADLLDHFLINHILPFALTLKGLTVFHASASCIRGQAVAFLGDGGAGKSTMAASLLSMGYPALADDCVVLDGAEKQPRVLPSHPNLRLWPSVFDTLREQASKPTLTDGKKTLRLQGDEAFNGEAAPLARLFVLSPRPGPPAPPTTEKICGAQAIIELLRHSYRLDLSDRSLLADQLNRLARLSKLVSVCRLVFGEGTSGIRSAAEVIAAQHHRREVTEEPVTRPPGSASLPMQLV